MSINSDTTGNTDVSVKYQRLASEFVKLRSQVSVLKSAVVEEQEKSARFQDELAEKETLLRKFQDENEGLLFRNRQLVKRIENLQKTLDDINKIQAAKGKKKQRDANLRLFVDLTDQPTNLPGTSTGTDRRQLLEQELERHLAEISELHSKIADIERTHEKALDSLNGKIASLEAENMCLQQKLDEAERLHRESRRDLLAEYAKSTRTNGLNDGRRDSSPQSNNEQPKQNGQLKNESTAASALQNATEKPRNPLALLSNGLLSEHTKRLFDEANHSRAQWEGAVAALEHELETMRRWKDEQTNAADSVDPDTKAAEKSLNAFLREKIKQLSIDLRFAQGEAMYYKDECEALLDGTRKVLENRPLDEDNNNACSNCSSLKEILEDTRNNFELQMKQLHEHIDGQELQIQEQKEQIRAFAENTAQSNSFTQSFRRMVGK